MNIDLKAKILKASIEIENELSEILMQLLQIKKEEPKTLGKTGSALSFKAKADLLLDLDKIDSQLHKDLILFMEIRNQFIHNIDTNSFEEVINRIGKEKHLLSFLKNKTLDWMEKEKQYEFAFSDFTFSLNYRLIDIRDLIGIEMIEKLQRKFKDISHDLKMENLNSKIDKAQLNLNQMIKEGYLDFENIGKLFKKLLDIELNGLDY